MRGFGGFESACCFLHKRLRSHQDLAGELVPGGRLSRALCNKLPVTCLCRSPLPTELAKEPLPRQEGRGIRETRRGTLAV